MNHTTEETLIFYVFDKNDILFILHFISIK